MTPLTQHAFIVPEELRPVKLVGSGTAGVVLCCSDARGRMLAVKKLTPDTDRALQRCLREVQPPQRTLFLECLSAATCGAAFPRRCLADDSAGTAHVPAAASQHCQRGGRVLFHRHGAIGACSLRCSCSRLVRLHAVLPRRSRVAHSLQHASADEPAHSGTPAPRNQRVAACARSFMPSRLFAVRQYILVQVLCGLR